MFDRIDLDNLGNNPAESLAPDVPPSWAFRKLACLVVVKSTDVASVDDDGWGVMPSMELESDVEVTAPKSPDFDLTTCLLALAMAESPVPEGHHGVSKRAKGKGGATPKAGPKKTVIKTPEVIKCSMANY